MPLSTNYQVITSPIKNVNRNYVIMTYLTKDEENLLDTGNQIQLVRDDHSVVLSIKDVYIYGEIDFTHGSDDMQGLNKLDPAGAMSNDIIIPSKYNYEKHSCSSPINKYLFTLANSSEDVFRYRHGCLNKPKLSIIFRTKVW